MTWLGWLLSAWLTLGALWTIAHVGKPRQALDSTDAILSVVLTAAIIVGYVLVGTR